MFNQIELTCFRQHRSLTVNFLPGLNAIRGANEAGKTSIFEAIAYGLFGARALREPLAETVTWGCKETELRVRLWLTLGGDELLVTRSKSGASVWLVGATEPFVTGHDAVKEFFENKFQAKADTAGRLMIASQQALQGALQDGPGAAIKLIETLANFSLIDRIISLAQEELPNGNTKAVQERIALLEGQLGDEPPNPTLPLADAEKTARGLASQAAATESAARKAWQDHQPEAQKAELAQKSYSNQRDLVSRLLAEVESRRQEANAILVPCQPAEAYLEELRRQVQDADRQRRARAALAAVMALPESDYWGGDRSSLEAELVAMKAEEARQTRSLQQGLVEVTRLEGQLIKETACAFCGKDLRKVPEVETRNTALAQAISDKRQEMQAYAQAVQEAKEQATIYQLVLNEGLRVERLMSAHREFLVVDENFVPAVYTYNGPVLPKEESGADPAVELREATRMLQDYQKASGRLTQALAILEDTKARLEAEMLKVEALEAQAAMAESVLEKAGELGVALAEAENQYARARSVLEQATMALSTAVALYEQQKAFRASIETQLADAKKEFKEMTATNALIVKLRSARPKIADELWSIVNAGVGKVFSDVRGVPSVVTREDNDFKVDGHGIKGLSGSTLDAFGLAVRVSLTNTFLPHTDFMMLDEPAAAADDERERNMLGMIAASGFDQVLLVTHSDQCESFATNVVRI